MEKGSRSAQQRARNAEARKAKLAAVEAAKPVEERLLHRRDLADPVIRQFSAPRETALTRIQTWFEEFLVDEHVRRCETTEEAAQYFRPGRKRKRKRKRPQVEIVVPRGAAMRKRMALCGKGGRLGGDITTL
ncbi:MAG: hypothetical protein M1826_000113 [Phylliscum demangeonii]|nr:MAG: hypothetical protein M1826_000113 [Phylliscum demangeonii]